MNDEVFPINVNYALPLTDMIHAGNYDAVHCSPLHDGHQPPTRNGIEIVSIELLSFDRNYELAAMVAEIDRRGFRSANLYEFLALGAQYPDLQRQSWLVTLGAAEKRSYARFWSAMNAGEDALIPCLFTTLGERTLLSAAFDGHYRPGFSFACVRK